MSTQEIRTFCRVCEAVCGVIASVEDGRITKIRSDPEHVLARGHFCKKAMGAVDVTYDPDRVLRPLKRNGGPGEFTPISWEQAFAEISDRLGTIRAQHGASAFATNTGNPCAFAAGTVIGNDVMAKTLGVKWNYTVNGEDGVSLLAACETLYGTPAITKPDFWNTKFALIVGANPIGSHGSVICEPVVAKSLRGIVERGGRVVVVDPRRSETAQHFEHLPIRAGGDAHFMSALLREVIAQGHADHEFLDRHARNFDQLREMLEPCTPEWASEHCGIPAQSIRELARDLGSADGACVYGRTGTCTQRHGTLSNFFIQLLNIVTGNLDRRGGVSFGYGFVGYTGPAMGSQPSRTTGLPDVTGLLGSVSLASDIDQPGPDQVRALMMVAANPALTAPANLRLQNALQQLDLFFSIDLYVNETNRLAHYILPGVTMWEREDVPILAMTGMMLRPSIYATPAVIARQGEAKEDWEIMYEILRRLGLGDRLMEPRQIVDASIRGSRFGDQFGANPEGLTLDKVLQQVEGVALMDDMPVGIIDEVVGTIDKRIPLATPLFRAALVRLLGDGEDASYALRLHSMREPLTHNSWMHNADSLARTGREHYARLNPDDAKHYGIGDGSRIRIRSAHGEVEIEARLSERVSKGNVALPHGWSHQGGWQEANRRGGVNSNALASSAPEDADPFSGGSVLNGIPIEISPVALA